MNQKENTYYQRMIRNVRRRNIEGGGGWPGKPMGAPAVTLYPNILAEIVAAGMWLWCPAQHSRVSKEIMAAILEDNEELSATELSGLCNLYERKAAYLVAPTLQMVDPSTNKGKYRLQQIGELLAQVNSLESYPKWRIEQMRDAMERGEPVTYAAWARSCQEIKEELERQKRKGPRSTRLEGRAAV